MEQASGRGALDVPHITIEAVPVLVWMSDTQGRRVLFNKRWLDFRGRPLDWEAGEGWLEGLHKEDRAPCLARYLEVFQQRREFEMEYRLRRHDGEFRWILERGAPRFAGSEEFLGYAGSAIDITDRKYAEEQVRHRQEKLEAFFEAASQGILAVEEDGKIQMVNRTAIDLFGYSRAEFERLHLEDLVPERYRGVHSDHQRHFFSNLGSRPMGAGLDLKARRKDGSEFPVDIGLSFAETPDGPAVIALITDISERKRIEEMLQKSNEELRYFLNAASHDLQEALRTIRTYAELLVKGWPKDAGQEQGEVIQFIVDGVDRLQSLIQALLSYQRIGIVSEKLEPREAGAELEAAIHGVQALVEQTGASITRGSLPRVLTGEPGLADIFQNLIGNAMKYRGLEAPRIHIEAEREGRYWRFAVRDNGGGIDPEYRESVFKPFRRLHGFQIPGSGMGLAISRKIVERHGGRMWLESEPGRGSTFFFTLQAAEPESEG